MLAATLQISHLFLQKLDADIYGLNGWTDFSHEKSSGNLSKVLKNKHHSKTYADKLLHRSPPLQNSLGKNSVDEIMLNVVQHTPQHFQEMLPGRMAKTKALHKIVVTAVDHH